MKNEAIYLTAVKKLEIDEYKIKQPIDDELLIKIDSVGICGSDISYYSKGKTGVGELNFPHILGHESSGVVMEIGDKCKSFKIGDRVTIEPGVPCGKCEYCLEGHYNCCENLSFMSTAKKMKYSDGAFVNYCIRPSSFVYHLPDNVSFEQGALIEPLSVAYHAVEQSGIKAGQKAAIIGCGPIAGCLLLMLKAFGIGEVAMSDIADSRISYMKNLGATLCVNTKEMDEIELSKCFKDQYQVIFDTSCNEKAINGGINQLKKHGTLMQIGVVSGKMNIDIQTLFLKEACIKTSFRYKNTYEKCISLISNGLIDPMKLVSHTFGYKDYEEAFKVATTKLENPMKVIIKMN